MNNTPDFSLIVAKCLEQMLVQGKTIEEVIDQYPQYTADLRPLLESAMWLDKKKSEINLASDRLSIRKEQLINQIRKESTISSRPGRTLFPNLSWKKAYWQVIAIILILIIGLSGVGGGVALAAQNSLPGDPLYPVKINLEKIPLMVISDPLQREQILLKYSQRRLQESETLLTLGREQDLEKALESYHEEIQQFLQGLPKHEAYLDQQKSIQQMRTTQAQLHQNEQRLNQILKGVPAQLKKEVVKALALTQETVTDVGQLIDTLNIQLSPLTATMTPTEESVATTALNSLQTAVQDATATTIASMIPPGLLKKTQTGEVPPNLPTQVKVKPSKTPRPTAKARPVNTHKPSPPSPVKPTKKPKP